MRTSLDSGEAAVIGLVRESNANFILVDECKARKIARSVYGLHVVASIQFVMEL